MQKKKNNHRGMGKGFFGLVGAVAAVYAILSFYPESLERGKIEKQAGLERKLETKVVQPVKVNDVNEVRVNEPNNVRVNDVNCLNFSYKPKKISKEGLELIKQSEGFSDIPYDDAGNLAIGYGYQIKENENFSRISKEYAEKLLIQDLASVERAISEYVEVPLTQSQYDALCSFVYNIGKSNFKGSTLLKKLNDKDYDGVAEEFKRWNKAGGKVLEGLKKRRAKERELFLVK